MMLLWCSLIMASLSCVLALAALWSCFRVRKLLQSASARSLHALSAEVTELTFQLESLQSQQKRLASRIGMREARAAKEERDDEGATRGGPAGESIGEKPLPRSKLKEIARARGFKVQ